MYIADLPLVADILDSCCNFVLRTVDEIVLNGFCLSTAVAGAGVVQRYLVQIIECIFRVEVGAQVLLPISPRKVFDFG